MRIASTSAGEAGISAGPGEIGVNDDTDDLIVVLVLRGQMVYDRLLSDMTRSFTRIATWRRTDVLYHTVDPLGIALSPARHKYSSVDCLSVLVACVSWVG